MQLPNLSSEEFDIFKGVQDRVAHSIENKGLFIDLSTDSCRKYLQRKVNSNAKVVVMYIDIAGSTQMSHDIPPLSLSIIIQIFSQEVSLSIVKFGGYVLKFVGFCCREIKMDDSLQRNRSVPITRTIFNQIITYSDNKIC